MILAVSYTHLTSTVCCLDRNSQCLLDFYKKCNIDFENFCFDYDEEEIMHKTVKIEVWVKDQEELDFAISCYGAFPVSYTHLDVYKRQ